MRFLFLNQYAPPDRVPTARLLGELAEELRAHGHAVEIVSATQDYQGRPVRGGSRLRRELQALWTIFHAGLKPAGGRPDVILALSSPPGLPVVGALLALWHRAKLAHWAMDIYPELALALGEVDPGSVVVKLVRLAMRWAYRQASLIVALDEDMRAHLQPFCPSTVRVQEPWLSAVTERQPTNLVPDSPGAPWAWLYSGNLGRAHEWQTLLDAQRLLEDLQLPIHLIFQGDGAARAPAKAYAQQLGLRRCEWTGYVAEDDLVASLLRAHVLIVTQRPETRGLLWPSKLALLERLPRPVLFVGPEDGFIARRLRAKGGAGIFAPGCAQAIADWLETNHHSPVSAAPASPEHTTSTLKEGCSALERWLEDCAH